MKNKTVQPGRTNQFSIRAVFYVTAFVALLASVPYYANRIYYAERTEVKAYLSGFDDVLEYRLKVWEDDFTAKVMGVIIVSKLNPEHKFYVFAQRSIPIGPRRFVLSQIGGFHLCCHLENAHGSYVLASSRHASRNENTHIGTLGEFRDQFSAEIDSLESVVRNYEAIVESVNGWPGVNDEAGIISLEAGLRLRFYTVPVKIDDELSN